MEKYGKIKILMILILFYTNIICINNVKAVGELPDNGGIVTSSQIIQTKTGTGPWDENDEAGNDSSEDNNIVRSFDQVTWTIESTMRLKEDATVENLKGGILHIRAELPEDCANVMKWDLGSMGWTEGTGKISDDGRIFTAQYKMSTNDITIPGKQSIILILSVGGAKNNLEIIPTITVWLDGNEESEKVECSGVEPIRVSAIPKYNVSLQRNTGLQKEIEYMDDNGEIKRGRLYGYGMVYQLYNNDKNKGLKGIEYPDGQITSNLKFTLTKSSTLNPSDITDITSTTTPILYNYKLNNYDDLSGLISDREMNVTWHAAHLHSMAGAKRLKDANKATLERYCYDSGSVLMEQIGNNVDVTIKDYKFDGTFPTKTPGQSTNSTAITYSSNIGCFSSVYFQVLVPYSDETMEGDYNYYLTVEDGNFSATSLSGQKINTQIVTTDDSDRFQHSVFYGGAFTEYHWLTDSFNLSHANGLYSYYTLGDAKAAIGQKFVNRLDFTAGANNDIDKEVYDVNALVKFDGSALKVSTIDGITWRKRSGVATNSTIENNMKFKMLYAAKKDGTNWNSDQEMKEAVEEDLEFFNSEEELKNSLGENALCIGVLYESISGTFSYSSGCAMEVALEVTNNASIGEVYQFVSVTSLYFKDNKLDRDIQTRGNSDAVFPKADVTIQGNYIKSEYDDNGNIKQGTHSGGYTYGQSLLIVGGVVSVDNKVNQKNSNGSIKTNYDIGRNENEVEYIIKSQIKTQENSEVKISDITITVESTLDAGLTYVPGSSNVSEPEIVNNSNGTTTLIWKIYGYETDKDIPDIIYKTKISEESQNGQQYSTKVLIHADKIGPSLPSTRTSTATIQITNLASHRLYKTAETPVIEKNGEIHYTLSYKNNTDSTIPNFQLLDILPYNGDNRGTDYTGTYILDRVVITQEDSSGNILYNSNLDLLYTNDESVIASITSKDENLGEGWRLAGSETIKQKVSAIALKGEIGAQGKVTVDIYLKTLDNRGLDKYVNSATAQVYKETEEMATSNVISQVVERKIEGIAWEDINANGMKDENEQILENIEVTLTDAQGQQVTDVNGNIVGSVKTDENGYYKFENLPKENYYVKVSLPNSKYQLTEKEVGSNNEINSKFDIDARETDEITKLNSIDLPELTVSNVNAGFVKRATKVVVNYREVGNESGTLLEQLTIDGRIDDPYNTENRIDEINEKYQNKYEYVRVEGSINGTMTEDTIYITYWYQKKATNVKVLHVLEGTDVSNPENITDVLYPTEEKTGRVDDIYNTQNRLTEINQKSEIEYELVTDEVLNKTGNMAVDTIYVIYEYRTIPAKIKVNHLEKDTDTILYNQEVKNGLVGENYQTANKLAEINKSFENKYELVTPEPENKNGSYTREEQIVTYYYQKKMAEVEVNYLEVGTEKVLESQELLQDRVDSRYTTENKLNEINKAFENKYEFVETTGDATEGVYKLDKQVVNYYYQKKAANVKILHVLEGTDVSNPENVADVLYETEEIKGRVDDRYTTQNRLSEINIASKEQYDLVADEVENKNGNMELNTIYVVYEYRKALSTIKIEHRDVDTNEDLLPVITENGIVGTSYTTENRLDEINEKNENKYEFVTPEPSNKNGEYKREEQTITYYYSKKPSKVIVKYVDVDTGKELVNGEEIKGKVDSPYETVDKIEKINETNVNKYILEKTTGNTGGNMTLETIEVVYYYKRVEAQVIVKHIDEETGEEIAEREYLGGYVGDKYTTNEKEIEGYRLVEKRIPINKDGVMTEEIIEVVYYYNKIPETTNINTGDIAVYAIVTLAVLCVIGIVFVVSRNKNNK